MSKAIGVDISDASVEVADLRHLFSSTTIKGLGRVMLPVGIVKGGVIQDMDALVAHVKQAAQEAKPSTVSIGTMYCAIPESKVFTHVFSFPRELGKKELEDAINIQFSEYFPFEKEQTYYDWDIVQETEQTRMVLVGATEKVYVDQLQELAKVLGVKLGGIDIESVSTARAIVPTPEEQHAVMMIDMGANVTSLSVFDEHALQMTYALDIGGIALNEQLAKKLDITPEQAETMRKQMDLVNCKDEHKEALEIIESILKPVVEEIARVSQFYEGNYRKTVKEIILCGGLSLMGSMAAYLGQKTTVPVSHGNALSFVKKNDTIQLSTEESILFANVIGLAHGPLGRQFKHTRFNFLTNK